MSSSCSTVACTMYNVHISKYVDTVIVNFRYIIGHSDLTNGVLFGWLSALGNKTGQPFIADYSSNSTEVS